MFANKVVSAMRRSVVGIGLAVAGFLTMGAPAPTHALPISVSSLQTYGGGQGWSYSVVDNLDVTRDGRPDFILAFFHYAVGYVDGTLDPSRRISNADGTVTYWGTGTFNRVPCTIKAIVKPTGGVYGKGEVYFSAYDDQNRNGFAEANERAFINNARLPASYMKFGSR